jgi:hypothetical protein
MNRQAIRNYLPAILIFIFFNAFFLLATKKLESWGFDYTVLAAGNLLIFAVSFVSLLMVAKGLQSKNNHAFFRMVYGNFLIKLLILAGAAFAYIMQAKKEVNKTSLFFCMGLYIVYTVIEVSALVKMAKQKKNA